MSWCLSLALRTCMVEERTERYRLLSNFHLCIAVLVCPPQQMCSKQIRWRSIESHVHRHTYMCVSAHVCTDVNAYRNIHMVKKAFVRKITATVINR